MFGCVHMCEESVDAWKNFTKSAVKFLDMYRSILDTYVLDFFTEDLWSQLNPQWTVILETLTPCQLADFLCRDAALKQRQVWPLSLQALRATAFAFTLPRKPVSSPAPFTNYLKQQIQDGDKVEMECDGNNILERDSNFKVDLESKSPSVSMMNVPTVIHTNIDSNATNKCSEVLSKRQNSDNTSVVDTRANNSCVVDTIANNSCVVETRANNKKSIYCDSHKHSIHEESFDIQISNKNKSTMKSQEKICSVHHCQQLKSCETFETSTAVKDSVKLIQPIQQVCVNWGDTTSELSAAAGQHKLLHHIFRRHLKPKKQHEVARLALVAGEVARSVCDGVMIDVGSGQGHLSRLLAYGHHVRVVCLEAQDQFISGAMKFDNQLEMAVEKFCRKQCVYPALPPAPRHAACLLQPHMDPHTFTQVVRGAWPELESGGTVCGLVGLHTCGNLASTMLRIFSNMSTCRAVVSVACCYMKLHTLSDEMDYPGYPLSKFVCSLPGFVLSYQAREVACHAIEMYISRLKLGAENLKVHCYRASLEEIIMKHWPQHHHAGLRSVTHAHRMEFSQYAVEAVSRLKDIEIPEEDLTSARTKHNLSRWMQVVIYYSLRLLLAPVVESVILLDRLIFLYETGAAESLLVPTFDPLLSPRNHVLVALKATNKL